MQFFRSSSRARVLGVLLLSLLSCNSPTSVQERVTPIATTTTTTNRFADGVKGVKVITSIAPTSGSFVNPLSLSAVATASPIPSPFPGNDGVNTFTPGVSASQYFDLDGVSTLSKPSWLQDIQLGITSLNPANACAAFGGTDVLDVENFYRTSEYNCTSADNGTGSGLDPVFARIVLNRDPSVIGSSENLMIQIEYQASGLHLNSDGTSTTDPEDNLDQLWKVYWNSTLASNVLPKSFSIFVPPNYGACKDSGSGQDGPGFCDTASNPNYKGSPVKVKQILIPLSAYPQMKVIQLTRVKGRISHATGPADVGNFCTHNSPLCLGIVIRSITLMRM